MSISSGAPWKLSPEKAQKELKQFLIAGWILVGISLVAFGWISIASLAFGARSIILSYHKSNTDRPKEKWFKAASIMLVVLSALEIVALYGVGK